VQQARGHMNLAAQAWRQVLLADPNNTEALAGLAGAAAIDGDVALSQTYLERLRRINPNDPAITRLGGIRAPRPAANVVTGARQAPARTEPPAPHLNSEEAAAYESLNAKRFDEAETRFKAILARNPGNAAALAGIGYVRMQQANFLGAISFL